MASRPISRGEEILTSAESSMEAVSLAANSSGFTEANMTTAASRRLLVRSELPHDGKTFSAAAGRKATLKAQMATLALTPPELGRDQLSMLQRHCYGEDFFDISMGFVELDDDDATDTTGAEPPPTYH